MMKVEQWRSLRVKDHGPTILATIIVGLLIVGAACQRHDTNAPRRYTAKGRVVSIAQDRQFVLIQHEEIKGFMSAMTMSFPVKNPALLSGLVPNDLVTFELSVTPQEVWISRIEKSGHEEKPSGSSNTASSNAGIPLTVGQMAPSFSLKDQDGRTVSLENYRGKPIAITFLFTRCPLPEYCPRFASSFAQVQKQLTPRFQDRFHLLSISIDPAHDSPAVLKDYGRWYDADFHTWTLLTGPQDQIEKVAAAYGVSVWDEEGIITHSAVCAVLTPSGRLHNLYRGNMWTPEDIISDLTSLLTEPPSSGAEN